MSSHTHGAAENSTGNDGWTTVTSSKRGGVKGAGKGKPAEKSVQKPLATLAPASSSSTVAHAKVPVQKREGVTEKKKDPEVDDLIARVVALFDRFLNTPTDTVVASYRIDGRSVNLYGLRESKDDMERIEVSHSHEYRKHEILFQAAKRKTKVYSYMRGGYVQSRPSASIVIDTYDAKSGKVSFYDDNGDYDDPAIRFNSNLRNWLETYEVILYNARELYMRLVGQYLHCPEAAADPVAGGSADSSSEVSSPTPVQHLAAIQSSTPMNALLRWPRATPEDLLGRLQWYMDRFVSPDVHKVMVAVIDGNISCWRGWGGFVSDLQLQPSHLAKHATTGIYTITQRSAPAVRYITKSKSIAKVVVEHHHNFKGIDADGWCQYWCDEMIDGELNTSSFDQEKRARHYNIYQLLSSPGTIVKLVNRRDY